MFIARIARVDLEGRFKHDNEMTTKFCGGIYVGGSFLSQFLRYVKKGKKAFGLSILRV